MNIKERLSAMPTKMNVGRLAAISLIGAAAVLFLELSEDVWLKEGFAWDAPIMLWLHQWSAPWLDALFLAITHSAGAWLAGALVVVGWVLWRRGEGKTAVVILTSFVGSAGLNALLKLFFARPRPAVFLPLTAVSSYSFPSGHTMAAIAVYGLTAVLLWQRRRTGWAVLAGLWVPLVALSRVYLGVHYPSDVLASLAVGTIWLVLILSFYQNRIIVRNES